jgi:hypothetical protein
MVKIALAHFMKNKEPDDLVTKLSEVRGGVACHAVVWVSSHLAHPHVVGSHANTVG